MNQQLIDKLQHYLRRTLALESLCVTAAEQITSGLAVDRDALD